MSESPAVPSERQEHRSASVRAPITNLPVTAWLLTTFGGVFVISRWIVPFVAADHARLHVEIPAATAVFYKTSQILASPLAGLI
ncbi:MAG: hypothetical protein NZ561_13125, partial [Phycisphaerae bacterium]|nr:hypothetical protein [Phycisphaerae bacterium]